MKEMLQTPPPMQRAIVNDESTISSNTTMDTSMKTVESNIGNLDNSVNHMAHDTIYEGKWNMALI